MLSYSQSSRPVYLPVHIAKRYIFGFNFCVLSVAFLFLVATSIKMNPFVKDLGILLTSRISRNKSLKYGFH